MTGHLIRTPAAASVERRTRRALRTATRIAGALFLCLTAGAALSGCQSANDPMTENAESNEGVGDAATGGGGNSAGGNPADMELPIPAAPAIDYEGPPVEAMLEVMESEPPQYAVVVKMTVPSGGHELRQVELGLDGERVVVDLQLTTPGADDIVTQALQELEQRVPLAAMPRAGVVLRITTLQRGAEYLVQPPAQVAEYLPPPR